MTRVNEAKKNLSAPKTVEQKIADKELLKRYYRLPAELVKKLNIAAATEGVTNEQFVIDAITRHIEYR